MSWKVLLLLLPAAIGLLAGSPASLRGKLVERAGAPALQTSSRQTVALEGEPETMMVLKDKRLAGKDLEVLGEYRDPEHFVVGPFYTSKSMFVHQDGKKFTITYWCPVCSIRTYTPGKCMCCQQETHLDLQEVD